MKRLLYRLGQRLIALNYVPHDADALVMHDLRLQIQSLRHENRQLRIELSAMKVARR